jgi:Tol biopolymer transport system component
MRRLLTAAVVMSTATVGLFGLAGPAPAKVSGPNGRIALVRFNPALGDTVTYTVNPDGSNLQQLPFSGHSEFPHWSPDGSELSIFTGCSDGTETCAATIVDPDTGTFREFKWPDPTLETHCAIWSPDGQRLACNSFGVTDPSRNGIYTIRSSDGGGLMRITSNPGGNDFPGDYSPDGKRIVFVRSNGGGPVGLFVVKLNGSGLRQIPTSSLILDGECAVSCPSWSPSGTQILFSARTDPDHRLAIWVVDADGSGLHKLPISPACGGSFSDPRSISCMQPGWSPDGTKIVFTRISADGTQSNIFTVNADGSSLSQVTTSGGAGLADWGTHRLLG